jgi:hypothetical protein
MNQYDQATTKRNKDELIGANMGKSSTRHWTRRWTKSPIGVIKINWDATMDPRTGTTGLGMVARDYEGRVVAMSSFNLSTNQPPHNGGNFSCLASGCLRNATGSNLPRARGQCHGSGSMTQPGRLLLGTRWTSFERYKDAFLEFQCLASQVCPMGG